VNGKLKTRKWSRDDVERVVSPSFSGDGKNGVPSPIEQDEASSNKPGISPCQIQILVLASGEEFAVAT
jgi:hypothetical protein